MEPRLKTKLDQLFRHVARQLLNMSIIGRPRSFACTRDWPTALPHCYIRRTVEVAHPNLFAFIRQIYQSFMVL